MLRIHWIFPACLRVNAAQGQIPNLMNSKQLCIQAGPSVWFLSQPGDFGVVAPQASKLKAFSHFDSILSTFHPILWHIPPSASLSVHFPICLFNYRLQCSMTFPLLCKGASRAKSGLDTSMDEKERKGKKDPSDLIKDVLVIQVNCNNQKP